MENVVQVCLSFSDWSDHMDKFSIKVKKGVYSKIEYQLWKKLAKRIKEEAVNVQLTIYPSIIHVYDGTSLINVFSPFDKSFGSYLFETLFTEEERNMAIRLNPSIIIDGIAQSEMLSNAIVNESVWGSDKSYKYEVDCLASRVSALEAEKKEKEKEEKKMNMFNFDFGPCTNNDVRLSMYGLAVRNTAGEWVSYNPESKEIINVEIATIPDGGKYMYKMPVAVSEVNVGDIIIHNRIPMFVTAVNGDGTFGVTDVRAGETKTIIPTRSPFGFNFITKIVNLFGNMVTPNASSPFGNMWMFAFMSDNKSFNMKDMVMLSMMSGNNFGDMNPMMLMLMADNKDDKSDWLIPLMLMNGGLIG